MNARRRNGQARVMSVRVNRPDVDVRARARILIPLASRPRPAGKPETPRDMLRVAAVYRDLPLRAAAYASREGAADRARVVVMVEPVEAAASLKAAAVGLFDDKGKLVAQATADQESLARTPPLAAFPSARFLPGTSPSGPSSASMAFRLVPSAGRSGRPRDD